jgi:hypothetical protein
VPDSYPLIDKASHRPEHEDIVFYLKMIMNNELMAIVFVVVLCVGMLAFFEFGQRVGTRASKKEGGKPALGAIEGAIFALLGLLIAFTFSGAASRFEGRRHLIIEEANDIGTAYLRIDLLPSDAQPEIRELFRRYVDARLSVYKNIDNMSVARSFLVQSQELQLEIWNKSVAAARQSNTTAASMLLLPALNSMFDITTVRTSAGEDHPPIEIFAMLGLIALASSFMAGYQLAGEKRRSSLTILGYVLILTLSVYVILDLEFPRLGIIRVDNFDRYLVDVRNSMK